MIIFLLILCVVLGIVAAWLYAQRATLFTQVKVLQSQLQTVEEQHQNENKQREERFALQMQMLRQEMRNQFNQEMQERTQQLKATNQEAMNQVTQPLKDELKRLQQLVDTQRQEHSRQTGLLEASIKAVVEHDKERDKTTQSLADALKNRGKVQGDWGEQVLENILRDSGLREGEEYEKQYNVTKEDGRRDRPDVVVRGANGAVIVVDSKVSLTAYTDYCGAEDELQRQAADKANYDSVWQHVQELSQKKYPATVNGAMPVTLMFVPNEGSYILAMNRDPQLSIKAYNKGVLIVNPTNLMVVLRLMFLTWQSTRQEKNNRAIVEAASKIYDKYTTFCESYLQLGNQLNTVRTTYDKALGQMREGRGNLGKQLQDLLKLGVTPVKQIPSDAQSLEAD